MIIVHMLGVVGVVRIYFKWKTPLFWRAITFTTFILLMQLDDSKSYFNAQR
jgi:hypothetical protein